MKITKIQLAENKYFYQKKQNNKTNTTQTIPMQMNAYQDFRINFRGRTPENFYAQEFNVRHMPERMKEYLNQDYETRKHIPPQQIMSESFKYLEAADNFSDVKSIYPEFSNLHEANLKGRTGILADIKLSRELSDTPLFKDGSDHLGMYLLKKIYLEGKTIKEINKDFYEKDLNPEYRGAITQPITYGTTSAYGIQYPKTDFWNSFIATRDEYKKFFVDLPKQSKAELKQELIKKHHPEKSEPEKKYSRKYALKKYQKQLLKDDIKKSKGDVEQLEKAIRRRFTKDDPEAAFIVKYLSPIMTIAADKIHLSEEEKLFAGTNKTNDNFFARFWKAKPELLEQYSTAITDTIELFEETYESGGTIPVNSEYQVIREGIENTKPIDFVPQRFVELLDYTQTIVPTRLKNYAEHEKLQSEWDEHFKWRYGEIEESAPVIVKKSTTDILNKAAQDNNAQVYRLNGVNGDEIAVTGNLDEFLGDYLRKEYFGFPPKFINMLINFTLKHPMMTEDAKLSLATRNIADKIDDERILEKTALDSITNFIKSELELETAAGSLAALVVFASYSNYPEKVYRTLYPHCKEADSNEYSLQLLKHKDDAKTKEELNRLYDIYRKPPTQSELNKIKLKILSFIRDFDRNWIKSPESAIYGMHGLASNIEQIQGLLKNNKQIAPKMNNLISKIICDYKVFYTKSLLFGQENKAQYRAKTEMISSNVINILISKAHQLK